MTQPKRTQCERSAMAMLLVSVSVSVSPDAYQGCGSLVDTYLPGVPVVFDLDGAKIGRRVCV
jgi:hypothetical protein